MYVICRCPHVHLCGIVSICVFLPVSLHSSKNGDVVLCLYVPQSDKTFKLEIFSVWTMATGNIHVMFITRTNANQRYLFILCLSKLKTWHKYTSEHGLWKQKVAGLGPLDGISARWLHYLKPSNHNGTKKCWIYLNLFWLYYHGP